MQPALANSSASLRQASTLVSLRERWRQSGERGSTFAYYLENFLAQLGSDNTRRSYAYAILEFWDWYGTRHPGAPSTPDRIERRDVIAFSDWLATRQFGLDELRLEAQPHRRLETAIYAIVKVKGSAKISEVRASLLRIPEFTTSIEATARLRVETPDPYGLDKLLACMVEKKLLARTPTLEELRRRPVPLGLPGGPRVDPDEFTYQLDMHTKARGEVERSSTTVARLAALSSLWTFYIERTGENTGQAPLLGVNPWSDTLKRLLTIAAERRNLAGEAKTPSMKLFEDILNTTGVVATYLADGRFDIQADRPLQHQPLEDVRDRALLLFMFYTGVRADEVGRLRRADVSRDVVTVIGKGRRTRAFRVPEVARRAVDELTSKLVLLAAEAEKKQPGVLPRMARLLQDDAPLFPAIARWGCNAYSEHRGEEPGLLRQAIAMMMRRRGVAAGLVPGTVEFAKLHPHGLRHLAAKTAIGQGTPVHIVQAVLGHTSLATTGVYLAERDPRRLALFQDIGLATAPEARPEVRGEPVSVGVGGGVGPRPAMRRPVIETTGVSVAPDTYAPARAAAAAAASVQMPTSPVAVYTPGAEAEPVAPGEGLVAIGKLAPLQRPTPSQMEIAALDTAATAKLDKLYEASAWGEGGKEGRRALEGLTHVDLGKWSGLVWWDGPTGNLRPQMPVAAPSQFRNPGAHGNLHASLEALWEHRMSGQDPKHPPSSALALLQWLKEALELSTQVDEFGKNRGIRWLKFGAPLSETRLKPGEPLRYFRAHREDKIALWFQVRSHTYTTAVGGAQTRHGHVLDRAAKRPEGAALDWYAEAPLAPLPWYAEADPVASLPDDERAALLDWLLALTGKKPLDTTPRFSKTAVAPLVSRVALAHVLTLLCAYDQQRDKLAEERLHTKQDPEIRALSMQQIQKSMSVAAAALDAAMAALTGPLAKPFRTEVAVVERIAERKGLVAPSGVESAEIVEEPELQTQPLTEEKQKEADETRKRSRSDAYMKLLQKYFGKAAADDPALRVYSYCGDHVITTTLEGGTPYAAAFGQRTRAGRDLTYEAFFRIDPEARSIVHTDAYKDAFAQQTGTDSECVARRVARHLWEQKRAGQQKRLETHPGELLQQLNTWAFYKVPCAEAQEQGLAARLKRLGIASVAALRKMLGLDEEEEEEEYERGGIEELEGRVSAGGIQEYGPEGAVDEELPLDEGRGEEEAEGSMTAGEREGFERSTAEAVPEGMSISAQGVGAKKPGFQEQWRRYEGLVKSQVKGEGGGGVGGQLVRGLAPTGPAFEAAKKAEEERRARAAAIAAKTSELKLKPPPKLGQRRVPAPELRVSREESEEAAEMEAEAQREAEREERRATMRARIERERAEAAGEEYKPNARRHMDRYFKNARRLVPSPITLLIWIYS